MNKIRHNFEYLQNYCNENNIELLKDYSNINIHSKYIIEGKCISIECYNNFKKSFKEIINYGAYCKTCAHKNRYINSKITNIQKYGVDNPFKSPKIKEQIKLTNLKIYGAENPFQSEVIKNKIVQLNLKQHGVKYSSQLTITREKAKQTCLKKYGVTSVMQLDSYKENYKQVCLIKYGCENPSQSPEIAEKKIKTSFRRKEYILPSNNIIHCQGYEPIALDELLQNELINEDDIITGAKNVPKIWYTDEQNKKHRHYVDIFISSQNRCIEVKSTWTAEKNKDNIFLKQQAGKDLGYKYEIWVYNNKGERVETYL